MKNKSFQEITNNLQQFFQDIENGIYGESIKNAFKKESSE